MNQYESQMIREGFIDNGYLESDGMDNADIVVVNTCNVTSTSESKSLRLIKNAVKKGKFVVATGCVIEDKDLDLSRLAGVNLIVSNKDKHKIPLILSKKQVIHEEPVIINNFHGHNRAFVKIQDGCDNVCSYCKVRIVRGASRSRVLNDIIKEVSILIDSGFKEIVLTGICMGAYGLDLDPKKDLCGLIRRICSVEGDWRLRLSSIEPKYITDDMIDLFLEQQKICRHLHLPFQSGDDFILKMMQRPYSGGDYLKIVKKIRSKIPDIAISTDIMVGFPGETDSNFDNTVKFLEEVRPMRMHIFPFSGRKGTTAYNYRDSAEKDIKRQRESILIKLADGLSFEFLNAFIGKEARILVENKRTKEGYLQGYTDRYIKVYIEGNDTLKNNFLNCPLTLTNSKVHGILPIYLS